MPEIKDGWIIKKLTSVGSSTGITIDKDILEKIKKKKGDNVGIKVRGFSQDTQRDTIHTQTMKARKDVFSHRMEKHYRSIMGDSVVWEEKFEQYDHYLKRINDLYSAHCLESDDLIEKSDTDKLSPDFYEKYNKLMEQVGEKSQESSPEFTTNVTERIKSLYDKTSNYKKKSDEQEYDDRMKFLSRYTKDIDSMENECNDKRLFALAVDDFVHRVTEKGIEEWIERRKYRYGRIQRK